MDTMPPTSSEIEECISTLKSNKTTGVDELPAEFLKAGSSLISQWLEPLFESIWEKEQLPQDWRRGLIVKLPKKGNLRDPNNWRGITLLSTTSKVFLKIVQKRLGAAIDELIAPEQAGFRIGKGCTDNIFALRNILEACEEWRCPIFINFIDFSKAFDSLHRDSIWKILQLYGVPDKITRILKMFYHGYECSVLNNGCENNWFLVNSGVRQGCNISPLLFIIATDYLMKTVESSHRNGLRWNLTSKLNYLAYADDICLFSTTIEGIKQITTDLATKAAKVGLKINKKKTKVMGNNFTADGNVEVMGEELENVSEFTYLGAVVNKTGGGTADLQSRIHKATGTFRLLAKVWRSKAINHKIKLKIFKSNVMSVLLYGCETWTLTAKDVRMLRVFQMRCLRRILSIRWEQRITNDAVLKRSGQEDVYLVAEKRRWRYMGHVLRRPAEITNVSLGWAPEGTRRRGRPRETWRRTTLRKMASAGLRSWGEAAAAAKNRTNWKKLGESVVETLCGTRHSAA